MILLCEFRRLDIDNCSQAGVRRARVMVPGTKRALAALVMTGALLGVGGAVSGGGTTASAARNDEPSGTASGTQPAVTPTKKYVNCANDGGYVERGTNQVIPRLDAKTQSDDIVVGPVIAWNTAANAFGSRAVTSMFITVNNFSFNAAWWRVSWYCTSDKSKAWLVFGSARVDILPGGQQVIPSASASPKQSAKKAQK
jgi:hypothetical protein